VTAGEQVVRPVVGGPAADVLGDPAGLADVAAAADHVGLDQLGAQLELRQPQRAGRRHRLLGALCGLVAVEPGQRLQLGDGREQRSGVRPVDDGTGQPRPGARCGVRLAAHTRLIGS
jgi:hypothetical protein